MTIRQAARRRADEDAFRVVLTAGPVCSTMIVDARRFSTGEDGWDVPVLFYVPYTIREESPIVPGLDSVGAVPLVVPVDGHRTPVRAVYQFDIEIPDDGEGLRALVYRFIGIGEKTAQVDGEG